MTNGSGSGIVIIGGKRFPVTDICLQGGEVQIEFHMPGPQEPLEGPITVIGADGVGCWQGKWMRLPAIPADDTWIFHYGIRQTKIESANEIHDFSVSGS